jgi:hypothetical protein
MLEEDYGSLGDYLEVVNIHALNSIYRPHISSRSIRACHAVRDFLAWYLTQEVRLLK